MPNAGGPTVYRNLELPVPLIILLAALAALRVVPHDLGVVSEGSVVNLLLVFVPPVIWLLVVLWRRVPHPFLTLVVIGFAYGVMLAVGHQVLWGTAFGGAPPRLGGTLLGVLDPGAEMVIFRTAAFFSSLVTGTCVGAVVGLVAWVIERVRQA
jgi:hypothetical protein